MSYVINKLYELTMFRDGDTIGTFMFTTTYGTDNSDPKAFCERFLVGVDTDLAELCEIIPAVLHGGEIIESQVAHLLATWPPLL
jgi:hypothetical protein